MRDEVLLFDLGGVIVEASIFPLLLRLKPDVPETELYDRWLESEAVASFERGETGEEIFARRFVDEWRVDIAPQAFLAAFADGVVGPFPGSLEMLERLRPHYVLACLSNCNATHWPRVEPVAALFDHAVVSHLCGLVKPDAALFAHVLDILDRPASAVRFFDDSLKNVRAAEASGIESYHTVGFDALERKILELGLAAAA